MIQYIIKTGTEDHGDAESSHPSTRQHLPGSRCSLFREKFDSFDLWVDGLFPIPVFVQKNLNAPRNPLTRWDVSSIPANGTFLIKKLKNINKNAQRVEND